LLDPDSRMHAVIYPVDADELAATDVREDGYDHLLVDISDITVLNSGVSLPPNAQVRWYASRPSSVYQPTTVAPIVQSYVDLVVGGALELEEGFGVPGFAESVIATTQGWSSHWVNDRITPYRAWDHDALAPAINRALVRASQREGTGLTLEMLQGAIFPGGVQEEPRVGEFPSPTDADDDRRQLQPGNGPLFIMGYGSLFKQYWAAKIRCGISSLSAQRLQGMLTTLNVRIADDETRECLESIEARFSELILVEAQGIRRGWYHRSSIEAVKEGVTEDGDPFDAQALDVAPVTLGAVLDPEATMLAMIYPVDREELALTDESYSECDHLLLSVNDAVILNAGAQLPPDAQVRWYGSRPSSVSHPTPSAPICQSYVDLLVGGALELQERMQVPDFAQGVVRTTYDWSEHWVNDRATPYQPQQSDELAPAITQALVQATLVANSPLTLDMLQSVRFPGQEVPNQQREERQCRGTYEAESATIVGGVVHAGRRSRAHAGFTGDSFVDYLHPNNDYVEWSMPGCSGGSATATFRYALARGDRPLQVLVNGQEVASTMSFPATGSWSSWGEVSVAVALTAGSNAVRLVAIGSSGANMDSLTIA